MLVAPSKSTSPIRKALRENPKLQLAWDNEVDVHVARNLLLLRKYRNESQTGVAASAGTSQGKIARIENGVENITIKTLKKMVVALGGRFKVSISPAELSIPFCPDWWHWINIEGASAKWVFHKAVLFDDGDTKTAAFAWKAPCDDPDVPESVRDAVITLSLTAGDDSYGAAETESTI